MVRTKATIGRECASSISVAIASLGAQLVGARIVLMDSPSRQLGLQDGDRVHLLMLPYSS